MHYAIIANPAAGKTTLDQKRSELLKVAEILKADIYGLDTTTSTDLIHCARELSTRCDVLVVAGGDGTLSDIINSIDTAQTPIAFLPLGTGNAMQYALKYKGGLADAAIRIRNGNIHQYDLIKCREKRRAFMLSIGIEGTILRLRDQYLARGYTGGFKTYLAAFIRAYFGNYKRTNGKLTVDRSTFEIKNLLSLMIVKQPYYGFGMNVVPRARFDDGLLHILYMTSRLFKNAMGVATAFTVGNWSGRYYTGYKLTVKLEHSLTLQIDGDIGEYADEFSFTILPKALKIKC